jgi:hypothetical protein
MITKPPCSGTADKVRPCIGYATCQAVPDCGGSAVAESLRERLGKAANVGDIWDTPGSRATECDVVLAMDCASLVPEPYFIYLCPEQANTALTDSAVYERAVGLFAEDGRLAQWLSEAWGSRVRRFTSFPQPWLSARTHHTSSRRICARPHAASSCCASATLAARV